MAISLMKTTAAVLMLLLTTTTCVVVQLVANMASHAISSEFDFGDS
jgi:hypothetical protein